MEHANNRMYEMMGHHSEEAGVKTRKKIWLVFWILLFITTAEVLLGIYKADMGISWTVVKWTFIIMTIIKAWFIVAYYMHLNDEKKMLVYNVVIPYTAFVLYLTFIMLTEALAVRDLDIMWWVF